MTLLRIPRIPLPIALFLALLLPLASGPALAAPGPRPYTHVDLVLAKDLMLAQLNAVRQEKGLPMLVEDPSVSAVALAHARDMVARDYFAHVSPEGATPQERLAAAGLPYPVGENLGALRSYGLTTGEIARGLLQSLLDSPPHRANLLDRRATHIGLGFCQDKDSQTNFMDLSMEGTGAGTVVVCQEFVRKPLKAWTPPMADPVQPREAVVLAGTPVAHYAAVALEIVDRDTQELVRYNHVPVVDGEFRMAVKLDQPGRYEVRVLGLQPDMLVQRPEPLGVFMLTVEGNRRRPAETSGPVF